MSAPNEAAGSQAQTKAREAAQRLGSTLRARLLEAMAQGGPAAAIDVCANEAQALTKRVARETGAEVGRSSLRLRNPANAGPDWVRARLAELGQRPAAGVPVLSEIATPQHGQRVARFAAPIAVEGPCLTCHGPRENIPEEVRSVLAAKYPSDEAHGYALGDLRGLLWAEVAIDANTPDALTRCLGPRRLRAHTTMRVRACARCRRPGTTGACARAPRNA